MHDNITEEFSYLNHIEYMVGVFQPLINCEKAVFDFNIKFLNNSFIKEFKGKELFKENKNKITHHLDNIMRECILKFNEGYNTIINNIDINNKLYIMQCSRFHDKYLLCTFYKNEDVLIKDNESLINKEIIEDSMDIILVVNREGKILYGNKKAVKTYGYTYNELLNLNIFDLRNEMARQYTEKQLTEALEKGIEFKTYHYKKDGSKFPVEVRSSYSKEEAKDKVISIIRDISNKENIEEDKRLLSMSLDIFEDAIIGLTKEFIIYLWSKGAEKKFGYTSNEIVGKSVKILFPQDKLGDFDNEVETVKNGNVIENFETTRIHKNSSTIDVSISLSPIYNYDGDYIGAIGIYKDISEKKELAKKLQEYEERWRFALEGSQFGVWDWNIVNNKMFYSNHWKEMFGYNKEDIGDSFEELQSRIHEQDVDYVTEKINKHFQGEEYSVEFRMRCKNNVYKWVKTRGRVIKWTEDGKPLRMIATVEDISARKFIEEQLKEKYKQLKLLKQEADNANKAKSLFLANISHEIRTPMNGILAAIQLLQLGSINEEQSKYIKMLKESAGILLEIINNLLDITKIESGTFKLNYEEFDLRETINNIYNNLLITGNEKDLEISYYLDPKISSQVIGDELKLKQILTNLVSNAVKFTEKGYISFRVKLLSSDEESEKIEFRVKDSGIGIEESFKDKIFKSFSQGDLSSEKKYMGTGLGLAISKELAALMKGHLWFESAVGEGTTFYFICEFKKSYSTKNNIKENPILKEGSENSLLKKHKVILSVEDNIINQEIMENIIKKKGYKYIAAYNGKEALEILKNHRVDLILMDVQMPELNGFDTTRIIRERELKEDLKPTPIIAMTAYAMYEDRDKCVNAGMNDYISKPFDVEKLYNIIENYIK